MAGVFPSFLDQNLPRNRSNAINSVDFCAEPHKDLDSLCGSLRPCRKMQRRVLGLRHEQELAPADKISRVDVGADSDEVPQRAERVVCGGNVDEGVV
jgi:hypothetical protein